MLNHSYSRRVRIQLIAFSFIAIAFLPILLDSTNISYDPYWRYQGQLITNNIYKTGEISLTPFKNHPPLVEWTNNFTRDIGAPLTVVILSKVVDLQPATVHNSPIYLIPFILSQVLLAKVLIRKWIIVPISLILAVSYQFTNIHFLNSAHRVALGFSLLFFILSYMIINKREEGHYLGIIVLTIGFAISYSTLVINSIVLITALLLSPKIIYFFSRGNIKIPTVSRPNPVFEFSLIVLLLLAYHTLITGWVSRIALLLLGQSSGLIQDVPNLFSLLQHSASSPLTDLPDKYTPSSDPSIWGTAMIVAKISAAILVISGASIRMYAGYQKREFKLIDLFAISFFIQGIISFIPALLFAISGGTNPRLLGLLIVPIFGGFLISSILSSSPERRLSKVVNYGAYILILVLILTSLTMTVNQPDLSGRELTSISDSDQNQVKWLTNYNGDDPVISDFNIASVYYLYGGENNVHQPRYVSNNQSRYVMETYYTEPESYPDRYTGLYYISNSKYEDIGFFHLGSVITTPNPNLSSQLSSSRSWQKIHSNGGDSIYHD